MFNSLSGEITGWSGERVFLLTGSVEWEIWTGERLAASMAKSPDVVRVFTYVHHRDDQLRVYGFDTERARELFLDLIKVEGVGPRLALKIMSGMDVDRFIEAVESENLSALESVPGLGRKTAQKVVLNLKGRLTPAAGAGGDLHEDIVSALLGMGFDRREARQAVREVADQLESGSYSHEEYERELLKLAIRKIGQSK